MSTERMNGHKVAGIQDTAASQAAGGKGFEKRQCTTRVEGGRTYTCEAAQQARRYAVLVVPFF
ncbi:hypothetical protein [Alteromonas sp. H39]|uniref:hypothetical protein n=1 Tax=Alteromonas sp. H39 TaxID=3389876 RepID=UPI0039E04605